MEVILFYNCRMFCGILMRLRPSVPNFLRNNLKSKMAPDGRICTCANNLFRKSLRIYLQESAGKTDHLSVSEIISEL